MNKKRTSKVPIKLKACVVALSLWGFAPAVFALSSSPVMAADTASNAAQEQVAKALVNKGDSLASLHRYEESLAIFNDLITRFGNSHNPKIQGIVVSALVNKGFDLRHLHRYEEALAVNNDLITRFGNSQNPKIQEAVAWALLNKGSDLGNLNRYEESSAVNNDLITRFGNSKNPIIQQAVAIARQRQQSQ